MKNRIPGIALSVDTRDLARLRAVIASLKSVTKPRVLKKALAAAAEPVVAAARQFAPRDTGRLAASIGAVVKTSRRTGQPFALVGARRGFKSTSRRRDGGATTVAASRYAHLVEFGTPHSAAQPFLRPAAAVAKSAAVAAFAAALEDELRSELALARSTSPTHDTP